MAHNDIDPVPPYIPADRGYCKDILKGVNDLFTLTSQYLIPILFA